MFWARAGEREREEENRGRDGPEIETNGVKELIFSCLYESYGLYILPQIFSLCVCVKENEKKKTPVRQWIGELTKLSRFLKFHLACRLAAVSVFRWRYLIGSHCVYILFPLLSVCV